MEQQHFSPPPRDHWEGVFSQIWPWLETMPYFSSFNSCPFLASHLTLAIPIIASILFFFVISCLLQTSFRDPGILPRATPSEAADLEKRIGEAPVPSPGSGPVCACVCTRVLGSARHLLVFTLHQLSRGQKGRSISLWVLTVSYKSWCDELL